MNSETSTCQYFFPCANRQGYNELLKSVMRALLEDLGKNATALTNQFQNHGNLKLAASQCAREATKIMVIQITRIKTVKNASLSDHGRWYELRPRSKTQLYKPCCTIRVENSYKSMSPSEFLSATSKKFWSVNSIALDDMSGFIAFNAVVSSYRSR